jgi:hypothetical protein
MLEQSDSSVANARTLVNPPRSPDKKGGGEDDHLWRSLPRLIDRKNPPSPRTGLAEVAQSEGEVVVLGIEFGDQPGSRAAGIEKRRPYTS